MRQAGICRDPALHFLQTRPGHRGGLTPTTELQLTARTLEEHHQLRCYSQRDFVSEVLLDQGESQIQPGSDAGGRSNTSVEYVNGVRGRPLATSRPMSWPIRSRVFGGQTFAR